MAFGLSELSEELSLFEGLGEGGFACGLQGSEALFVSLDLAADSLFVDGEERELFGVVPEDAGLGEGGVDLGAFGFDVAGEAGMTEGDDVVFDGSGAIETPFVFGDGLGARRKSESQAAIGSFRRSQKSSNRPLRR